MPKILHNLQHFHFKIDHKTRLLYRMQHFLSSRQISEEIVVFHTAFLRISRVFRSRSCKTYNNMTERVERRSLRGLL